MTFHALSLNLGVSTNPKKDRSSISPVRRNYVLCFYSSFSFGRCRMCQLFLFFSELILHFSCFGNITVENLGWAMHRLGHMLGHGLVQV